MLLRLMLVSVVASLGLDAPSGQDVGRWTEQGRACWCALADGVRSCLADELDGIATEEGTDAAPAPTPTAAVSDGAFAAVVDRMVADFTTVASNEEPAPAFEPIEVGEDLYPGLAYELNRASEGAPVVVAATEPAARTEPAEPAADEGEGSRGERLLAAVRLTGQALNAWAGLLRQAPGLISARE